MDLETKQNKRLIICLTGMPGAGKSTVANSLKEKGFLVITMGDIVREEARQRNLEMTDDNLGNLMLKLRNDLGPGAIAHLILKNVENKLIVYIEIFNVICSIVIIDDNYTGKDVEEFYYQDVISGRKHNVPPQIDIDGIIKLLEKKNTYSIKNPTFHRK